MLIQRRVHNAVRELFGPNTGVCASLFAPYRFLDEHSFLTKSGAVGMVLSLMGISFDCLTEAMLEGVSRRIFSALRGFDEHYRICQYVIKTEGARIPAEENYPNERIRESVYARKAFLEARGLFSVSVYWVILYEPPAGVAFREFTLSPDKIVRLAASRLREARERLQSRVTAFQGELSDLLRPAALNRTEAFRFFRFLCNLDMEIAERLPAPTAYFNHLLCDEPISVHRDGIEIGRQRVEMLALREPPKQTAPNLFRDLYAIRQNCILYAEFQTVSPAEAKRQIEKATNSFKWAQYLRNPGALIQMVANRFSGKDERQDIVPDKSATKNIDELGDLLVKLDNGDTLGRFSSAILFFGKDPAALGQASAEAVRLFGRYEASGARETYNALNAYLAIIPGNGSYNQRRLWMTGTAAADMALVYARSEGERRNRFLGAEYLFATETSDRTPYFANIHHNDVANVFISGVMGAGKSALSGLILESLQKIGAHVCILDVGGSYRHICERYGGSYVHFDFEKQNFFVNPFSIEGTHSNIRYLCAFLRLLLVSNEYKPTLEENRNLYEAVCELYTKPAEERRLGNLKLCPALRRAMENWVGNGEDAWLFDNAVDTVTINPFQVFDFLGADDDEYARVLEPLLFYLFRRHTVHVQSPELREIFKFMLADEVWRFLTNDTCRRKFMASATGARKHNAGLALVTQSAAHLRDAGLLALANELCPTKIFLYNPGADVSEYQRIFKWNGREAEQFSQLRPKRDFLFKRGDQLAERLELHLTADEIARYGSTPFLAKEHGNTVTGKEKVLASEAKA